MIAGKEEIERQKVFGRDHFVYEENSYFIDVNDDSERMWFQNRIGVPNYKMVSGRYGRQALGSLQSDLFYAYQELEWKKDSEI